MSSLVRYGGFLTTIRRYPIPGGSEASEGTDEKNHLTDVQRRPGKMDIGEGLVEQHVACEERVDQPAVKDKQAP